MKLNVYGNQPIITPRDPQSPMEAANKNYVDNSIILHTNDVTVHLTAGQNTFLDAVTVTAAEVNNLSGITSNAQTQLDSKLPLAGGTLTGFVTLNANPTNTLHAATKQYVDSQDFLKVSKSGDTLTGYLTLHADPVSIMQATTKQYVDSGISTHANDASIHMTSSQNAILDALTASATELNYTVGLTSSAQTQLDSKLPKAGGTMTGAIVLAADPTTALEPATKQYSDNQDALKVAKAGDTMTGFLSLNADPTSALHSATKQYVDTGISTHANDLSIHMTSGQNALIDAITATATEINYNVGVTSGVQSQLDSKLPKAGGTMTGAIVLAADPATALEPSTKQYSDAQDALKVAKAGDTMTGLLTLSADPTSALHATTKQYVDSGISTHANDASLHLTSGQNSLLDALTVSATELNYSVGVTSAVQTQLDSKLPKAGGTMTGAIVLAADPVSALQPSTKQYSDAQDALKVAKAGDTMTGLLTLSADPTASLHAATKQYVDSADSAHANDASLHLTSGQNTFLDAVTVTSTEVNRLSGVTSGVQSQLNSKFDKAGGSVSGDITLDIGKTVFVDKTPLGATELVNKAYVDSLVNGREWKDPVTDVNLINTNISTPPGSPVAYDTYIIGPTATGAWAGKEGYATFHNGAAWVFLQTRAVIAGDRFGVGLYTGTAIDASISAHANKLVTITNATPGSIAVVDDTMTAGATTLVFDPDSKHFGVSFTLTDALTWVPTNTSVNLVPGTGMELSGSILNAKLGKGIAIDTNSVTNPISVNLYNNHGLFFTVNGTAESGADNAKLSLHLADSSLTKDATGLYVSAGVMSNIADRVSKSVDSTVAANITVDAGYHISVADAPLAGTSLTNKTYVDAADGVLQGQITATAGVVATLNTDPTTLTYVNAQDALKVAKAGDSMSGFLTLHADPTSILHAATKQYVDNNISTHATNEAIHITSGQNALLDALTATATEINYNVGVTSSVQSQLNSKLPLAGGTLTGALTLNADPASALQPATKQYSDAQDALKVAKTGDTLTGYLVLHADPISVMQATTKQYVDSGISTHANDLSIHMTSGQNALLDALTVTSTELNYSSGVTSGVQAQLNSKLPLAGGTLTGALTLNADPASALQPATKQYSDAQDALKVAKAGDTLTGYLTLHADPISIMQATTKQYVDSGISTHASDASLHITSGQNALLDALTASATEINYSVGVTSAVQTQLDSKLPLAGGTLTGALTLAANPATALEPSTKQYSDAQDALKVAKAGDTMTGLLTLSADPTANLHASTKQYVDTGISTHANNLSIHMTSGQNALLDALTTSATELNYSVGVTSAIQTQLDSKLNLTGGTLTGALTLVADPTTALQPATKQYSDNQDALKVSKAGDTMTGLLTLSADPTANLHAATKQFVDGSISTLTGYVDSQDALKVAKAGDTLTGFLTLHANPTANLHAVTKQFVDSSIATLTTYINSQDSGLQGQITSLQSTVNSLNTDPVTKSYVDSQDNTKVNKAGDTLTGYLTLHADPVTNMQPASKQYVDAIAVGLITKPSVRLATTVALSATYNNGTAGVNSTLTGSTNGALSVDGKAVVLGDRILVKDQVALLQNGSYTVQQVGNGASPFILKRVELLNESSEIPGSYFYVYDGNTLKGTGWTAVVADPITFAIGTDDIAINQFSGQGSIIAGGGLVLTGNTMDVVSASVNRIVVNADSIDLATTGVSPGNYNKVAVDGYGRIISGTNPNTLAGYGIADGQLLNANLTSLSNVSTAGIIVRDGANELVAKSIEVSGVGLSVTNGSGANAGNMSIASNATANAGASTIVARDASGNFSAGTVTAALTGNASSATVLETGRNFSASGDVTAPAVSFNGAGAVDLVTTLSNTGVTPGDYFKVTVDAKGRLTAGSNPTTLAGFGIVDAYTITQINDLLAAQDAKINDLYLYVMARL